MVSKSAVLVIDMLNDFVTGKFGFAGARRIVPNIKELLEFAKRKKIPIAYVCDSHPPKDPEFKLWGPHAVKGTKGAEVIPELSPRAGDLVVEKRTYNGFFGTELDEKLRRRRVKNLILTGVLTDVCVLHTAANAFFLGYDVTVLADCVASPNERAHRFFLEYMRRVYGVRVIGLRELLGRSSK